MTESITTTLAKIPQLFVIDRNSTTSYQGKPASVKQVAEDLGVRFVLKGSVQKSAERIRIHTQLIDALTGRHLWVNNYDREFKDIFDLQDDITSNIAAEMEIKISYGESARVWQRGTDNPDAYLTYLRGIDAHRNAKDEADVHHSIILQKKALQIDPKFSSAWAMLGFAYRAIPSFFSAGDKDYYDKALEAAQTALTIDENNSHAYALLGGIYMNLGRHDESLAAAEKSVELFPNHSDNLAMLGIRLYSVGQADEAVAVIKKAMRLNPNYPSWVLWVLGKAYYRQKNYNLAIEASEMYFESFDAHLPPMYLQLAAAYVAADRLDDAKATIARLRVKNPNYTLKNWNTNDTNDPVVLKQYRDALIKAGLPE